MKLPNGQRCVLGTKLEDYYLNPYHFEGRHKARVFASVLGITLENVDILRAAILTEASNSEQAEARGNNGFGEVFNLRFGLRTARGQATILTSWIVLRGEDFPRLTTCYIL
jgi:hypothetical protein